MSCEVAEFDWVSNGQAVIVTDSLQLLSELNNRGERVESLLTLAQLPVKSIVLSFSKEASRHTFEIAKNTQQKKCIFCALHVFEATVEHAKYALKLMRCSDFYRALVKQEEILLGLDDASAITVSGVKTEGRVLIRPGATPYAMIWADVKGEYIHSVAEFFEVHYAHMKPQGECPFNFAGEVSISGILAVARGEEWAGNLELRERLASLSIMVAKHKATLTVIDNVVVSFLVAGEEYVELLKFSAGLRGLELTEFAIGVNQTIASTIDLSVNSQMNEGIDGIHVAIGDGSTGYHIDLICPDARVSFESKRSVDDEDFASGG